MSGLIGLIVCVAITVGVIKWMMERTVDPPQDDTDWEDNDDGWGNDRSE